MRTCRLVWGVESPRSSTTHQGWCRAPRGHLRCCGLQSSQHAAPSAAATGRTVRARSAACSGEGRGPCGPAACGSCSHFQIQPKTRRKNPYRNTKRWAYKKARLHSSESSATLGYSRKMRRKRKTAFKVAPSASEERRKQEPTPNDPQHSAPVHPPFLGLVRPAQAPLHLPSCRQTSLHHRLIHPVTVPVH